MTELMALCKPRRVMEYRNAATNIRLFQSDLGAIGLAKQLCTSFVATKEAESAECYASIRSELVANLTKELPPRRQGTYQHWLSGLSACFLDIYRKPRKYRVADERRKWAAFAWSQLRDQQEPSGNRETLSFDRFFRLSSDTIANNVAQSEELAQTICAHTPSSLPRTRRVLVPTVSAENELYRFRATMFEPKTHLHLPPLTLAPWSQLCLNRESLQALHERWADRESRLMLEISQANDPEARAPDLLIEGESWCLAVRTLDWMIDNQLYFPRMAITGKYEFDSTRPTTGIAEKHGAVVNHARHHRQKHFFVLWAEESFNVADHDPDWAPVQVINQVCDLENHTTDELTDNLNDYRTRLLVASESSERFDDTEVLYGDPNGRFQSAAAAAEPLARQLLAGHLDLKVVPLLFNTPPVEPACQLARHIYRQNRSASLEFPVPFTFDIRSAPNLITALLAGSARLLESMGDSGSVPFDVESLSLHLQNHPERFLLMPFSQPSTCCRYEEDVPGIEALATFIQGLRARPSLIFIASDLHHAAFLEKRCRHVMGMHREWTLRMPSGFVAS